MKKIIKTEIALYQYEDLNDKAKEKAFNEHLDFILNNPAMYENEKGKLVYEDYSKLEEKDLKEMIKDSIKVNDYWFFENGILADCTTYTSKHKKAGITEFKFMNKIYKI